MFYERFAESSISGHDILYITFENRINEFPYQNISKVMERSLILLKIRTREAVTYNHIITISQNFIAHFTGMLCRICIIAIYHDVAVGINLSKHGTYNISFALTVLVAYHGTSLSGYDIRFIGGIIVIDIYCSIRQCIFIVCNYFCNCLALIVTGYQYRNSFVFFFHTHVLNKT